MFSNKPEYFLLGKKDSGGWAMAKENHTKKNKKKSNDFSENLFNDQN